MGNSVNCKYSGRRLTIKTKDDETRVFSVENGVLLSDALDSVFFQVERLCGGRGVCGACRVKIVEPDGTVRNVLACQTRVERDLTVFFEPKVLPKIITPETSRFNAEKIEPTAEETQGELGLAVDLGTTTLVCTLVSLVTGRVLDVASTRNPQISFGSDVISRITAANDPNKTERMRRSVAREIGKVAYASTRKLRLVPSSIREIIVAGNTAMELLFVGRDVRPLGVAPFDFGSKIFPAYQADFFDWGVSFKRSARVRIFPIISPFVGGDLLSGFARLRRLGAFDDDKTALLLDVGTNGEAILSRKGRFFATSSAAGPALEGSEISVGSLAVSGAIYSLQANFKRKTWIPRWFGDGAPRSLCGSGLIDALAAALDFGLIAPNGRIREADSLEIKLTGRIDSSGKRALLLTNPPYVDDQGVWLNQRDVRQAQLAIGAIKTGLRALLEKAETNADELDAFYLSGGFGSSLDKYSARRVGLIPRDVSLERVCYCGNSSLDGAVDALLGRVEWDRLSELCDSVENIDLATLENFSGIFANEIRFPDLS